jgi:hypothetical protein
MSAAPTTASRPASRGRVITGWILSGLCILFFLFDSCIKLARAPFAIDATVQLGYHESVLVPLGVVLLTCTVLYTIPRTAVWGALLLTAYLGGATATHVRVGQPFVFPIIFGIIAWAGLTLRNPRVADLLFSTGDR